MSRYEISRFDDNTYVVVDLVSNREVCVCANYDEENDAEERARQIVMALTYCQHR